MLLSAKVERFKDGAGITESALADSGVTSRLQVLSGFNMARRHEIVGSKVSSLLASNQTAISIS